MSIPKLLDSGMNTLQGSHITTPELEEMGAKFCEDPLVYIQGSHVTTGEQEEMGAKFCEDPLTCVYEHTSYSYT